MKLFTRSLYSSLIVFILSLLVSCSTPKELEYREFNSLTIEKLGFSGSFIKMNIVYFNPNNFGLQLKRTDLDIFIDNIYVGHTAQEYQVNIPRKEIFSLPLSIEVDMKNLFKNGLNLLLKNKVMVKATGSVKVGKANVFMNFPVNYESMQAYSLFP